MGGVSERPARETEKSDLLASSCRGGERHPGPRSADILRGKSEEPPGLGRFARLHEDSSSACVPTGDSGCPLEERGGERRRHTQGVCTRPGPGENPPSSRTRPSLGPETRARRSPLPPPVLSRSEVARPLRYRGRANLRTREEPATGSERSDECAARRASPVPSWHVCVMRQTRQGGRGHRVSRGNRGSEVGLPVRRFSLHEIVRRRLVSNTHARSAPKRVAVRVNGDLARPGATSARAAATLVWRSGARWPTSPV